MGSIHDLLSQSELEISTMIKQISKCKCPVLKKHWNILYWLRRCRKNVSVELTAKLINRCYAKHNINGSTIHSRFKAACTERWSYRRNVTTKTFFFADHEATMVADRVSDYRRHFYGVLSDAVHH